MHINLISLELELIRLTKEVYCPSLTSVCRSNSRPCAPNLTASLILFICRCIGNTRTIVEALGLTIHKGKVVTFIKLESIIMP